MSIKIISERRFQSVTFVQISSFVPRMVCRNCDVSSFHEYEIFIGYVGKL